MTFSEKNAFAAVHLRGYFPMIDSPFAEPIIIEPIIRGPRRHGFPSLPASGTPPLMDRIAAPMQPFAHFSPN